MAEPMRIGLIGCGFFAQNHLNAWRDLAGEGAVLTAVCDIDPVKAKAAAAEFGAPRWYSDVVEMLDAEKLDLVDIVTRMDTHRAIVTETLARNIPTVVQKPFAPEIEECMAMAEMASKAGTFLAVHENFRFQKPMLRLAELVRAGTIGEPRWARLSFRTGFDVYKTQPYFLTEERLVILDVGIHILDLARVLLGEVDLVSCTTQRRNPLVRAEDTATMMLQHRSGAVSIVEIHLRKPPPAGRLSADDRRDRGPVGGDLPEARLRARDHRKRHHADRDAGAAGTALDQRALARRAGGGADHLPSHARRRPRRPRRGDLGERQSEDVRPGGGGL